MRKSRKIGKINATKTIKGILAILNSKDPMIALPIKEHTERENPFGTEFPVHSWVVHTFFGDLSISTSWNTPDAFNYNLMCQFLDVTRFAEIDAWNKRLRLTSFNVNSGKFNFHMDDRPSLISSVTIMFHNLAVRS